jgi:hypothetical protein
MSNFYIKVDQKVTAWISNTVVVEADSKEEAIKQLANDLKSRGVYQLSIMETETLYETEEPLTVKDNNGNPTIEIVDKYKDGYGLDGYGVVWDNVDGFHV